MKEQPNGTNCIDVLIIVTLLANTNTNAFLFTHVQAYFDNLPKIITVVVR